MRQVIHMIPSTGLIKNINNNNGKVGVFGISYPGFYSTMAAFKQTPGVGGREPAGARNWMVLSVMIFIINGAFYGDGWLCILFRLRKAQNPHQQTIGPDGFYVFSRTIIMIFIWKTGAISNLTKTTGWQHHILERTWWRIPIMTIGGKPRNTRNFVQDIPATL